MKTIIERPKLQIQNGQDGVWLHFSTSDGQHASLNLPMLDRGTVFGDALRAWSKEYAAFDAEIARLNKMQTLFCAKCGNPYKTDKPNLTIGDKPIGIRRLCPECELSALAGMLQDETRGPAC